ncbi:MAG TPA: hypothetical protein VEQ42_09485, partial [Pyrinomonadaceae bacterium]|nr:hypothetical protein [Pyrinomonadaceae bacterium]
MSSDKVPSTNVRASLRLADKGREEEESRQEEAARPALPRQFVTFTFYRARPEWRLLDEETKREARREFAAAVEAYRGELLMHSYSLAGLRTNADFMLWRIGYSLDP